MKITPGEIKTGLLHGYLLSVVAPRPICFASTIDEDGNPNLSPFSFFNVFGSKPPILIFSPARRVRDNTTKHTLQNAERTKEVVINVVNYNIVQQMNLASCEYGEGVNEFVKSGLTPIESDMVKPFRVKESPAQLECRVKEVIHTGEEGGAGNLIICEVLCMHINDDVLDDDGKVDPHKIDLVARMGGNYYCRASGNSVFQVDKPNTELGIGVDQLPDIIKNSNILTGNDLGILGNCNRIPDITDISDDRLKVILKNNNGNDAAILKEKHLYAKELIALRNIDKAWQILLS
ncbi:MAG: flavin reductase family protein [Chitinophagales bacterium]|nr:flavin reductase family protein [Chitinophagaceae bacterium]MCB9065419.1 flavin reductase family protein [Chitinophagales bacterium]